MAAIIEIQALHKKYGSVVALENINLVIDSNEPIGLVGKNGAGKTTLFSILCGALKPNSGSVNVLGHSPESSSIKGKISILLQDADFKKGVPVTAQLNYFARLQGMSKQQAVFEVSSLLEKLNNADYASKKPETLSYGQRKRLGIVQALIGKPTLVLLDEPTAGLDPIAANDIRKLIQDSAKDHKIRRQPDHGLNSIR